MSLIDANWCPQAAEMLNGKKISEKKKAELKAIFLEGLIRFLDIYAQTEIGEGIEIDITKVALHINSAVFENDDLYALSSIDDVYGLCESLTIAGLPIWRFLRLTDYQSRIFESGYNDLLISAKMKAADERPCYGCIWYEEHETFLGTLRQCKRPRGMGEEHRNGPHEPEKIKKCKWLTTMDSLPKAYDKLPSYDKNHWKWDIESAKKRFEMQLLQDPFRIPKELSEKEAVDLNKEYSPYEDFGRAFNNQKTRTECKTELRKAMYIEGMVRFFELYAKSEMGSRYVADIKNISLYVHKLADSEVSHIKSFEDVYVDLEEKILEGHDVKKFVKFDKEK